MWIYAVRLGGGLIPDGAHALANRSRLLLGVFYKSALKVREAAKPHFNGDLRDGLIAFYKESLGM